MSGVAGDEDPGGFARLLGELRDRSGLSYGTLAKRLHMSTSTLHRYCNGTAVPTEYAPVERLARACRATPEELVELHRRWITADAARRRRPAVMSVPAETDGASPVVAADVDAADGTADGSGGDGTPDGSTGDGTAHGGAGNGTSDGSAGDREGSAPSGPAPASGVRPAARRRAALIAAVAVVAVLGAVALVLRPPFNGADAGAGARGHRQDGDRIASGDATAPGTPSASPSPSLSPSPSPSPSGTGDGASASPSAAPSVTAREAATAVPLTVGVRPYVYDQPCSQHFLVDRAPGRVGPPAAEQDAPRWAAAYGAVSSDQQEIALTVQGTGARTVVLEALHVRVLGRDAPLAWNDYAMGVGCGGGVGTKTFDVDLDAGSPTVTTRNGQRDFPYKVSESDPEVFYVTARTDAHDVRWDLTLDWSSGGRRGTVHIDDAGTPFRTSADADRPGWDYPLGGGEWIERTEG